MGPLATGGFAACDCPIVGYLAYLSSPSFSCYWRHSATTATKIETGFDSVGMRGDLKWYCRWPFDSLYCSDLGTSALHYQPGTNCRFREATCSRIDLRKQLQRLPVNGWRAGQHTHTPKGNPDEPGRSERSNSRVWRYGGIWPVQPVLEIVPRPPVVDSRRVCALIRPQAVSNLVPIDC